jgi:hypothetical protein
LNPRNGRRDRALERAVWPEFAEQGREPSEIHMVVGPIAGAIAFACFLFALVWIVRLFVESRRWSRVFKQQSDVHARLIDKFSTSQELAAYMDTDAGRRFLEAAPITMGVGVGPEMSNAVARVFTPLQIGIVLALLGAGLLGARHASPDTATPLLVLGMIVLMPGIGFILSAAVTWVLARRLGLLPEKSSESSSGPRESL